MAVLMFDCINVARILYVVVGVTLAETMQTELIRLLCGFLKANQLRAPLRGVRVACTL